MKSIPCFVSNPTQQQINQISAAIETDGFAVVDPDEKTEEAYLKVAKWFGPVQWHERSRENGIVDVSSDPSLASQSAKEFLGLGTGGFEPHSDGAFLDALYQDDVGVLRHIAPPSFLLLRCVKRAAKGGESLLIDCQTLLADLIDSRPDLIRTLFSSSFHFVRPEPSKLFPTCRPVFSHLRDGNLMCRFRANPRIAKQFTSDAPRIAQTFREFCTEFAFKPVYERRFMLPEGHILVVDNFRMLHGRTEFDTNNGACHRHLTRVWIADHLHRNRIDARSQLTMSASPDEYIEHPLVFLPAGHPVINGYATENDESVGDSFNSMSIGIKLDSGRVESLKLRLENLIEN